MINMAGAKSKTKPAKPKGAEAKPKEVKKAGKPEASKQPKVGAKEKATQNKALILSFRRGRHTQRTNQFLLQVNGADTRAKASQYIGRRVVWTAPGRLKKQIFGKITTPHGNNGVLRARFSRGLPGTAVGKRVELL
jgi:large subunit ribosomal protein L35Ae